jgi:hypothetical protein
MKIEINKTRKKLAVSLQSACNESVNGFDIMFNLLLDYVPTKSLKEKLKLAKQTKEGKYE